MKRLIALVCLVLLLVPSGVVAADTPPPYLTSVSPSSASNADNRPVTITLYGSNFVSGMQGSVYPCFAVPQYGSVSVESPTRATITYNFYGQVSERNWHIRLRNPDGDVTEVIPFTVYSSSVTATTTTSGSATTVTTTTPQSSGKNSVFFETNPSGATIYFNGDNVGSSAFTYYTDRDGTFPVVVKKLGYQDYEDRVTVREGQRVRFYAKLEPLSSTSGSVTATPATTGSSSPSTTPVSTVTTIRKSTLKMPTPLGTDPPLPAEESPADPSLALIAAGIAVMVFVIRRR